MITDHALVVAKLRLPALVSPLSRVIKGLSKMYPDAELVIITDGPLFEYGWMIVAQRPATLDVDDDDANIGAGG